MESPDPELPVDYTQVLHQEHLLKNVLLFLPDDTVVDDLDNLVWVDREFQDEVTKERRRRIKHLLTYGAAAVHEGHEHDETLLTSILGEQDNWKTSKYAMILVGRTFSGAKHDPNGPYRFENLYPELPTNSESKPAFRKVLQWWRWMCENNTDLAIKTDLLSLFLFAGENWKRRNQPQNQKMDLSNMKDELSINGESLEMKATFHGTHDNYSVVAEKQVNFGYPRIIEFTVMCSPGDVFFTSYSHPGRTKTNNFTVDITEDFIETDENGFDDRVMDKFRIDKNDTALWAHACVDVLISKSNINSLSMVSPIRRLRFRQQHAKDVGSISRRSDQDNFAAGGTQHVF
jgi:hypothetical protein